MIIILKIISLCLTSYLYQGQDQDQYYWKGDFTSIYASNGAIETNNYNIASQNYCNEVYPEISTNTSSFLCSQFGRLGSGLPATIAFSAFSILSIACTLGTFIHSWYKIDSIYYSVIASIVGIISEFIGVVVFIGISRLTFSDNCKYLDSPLKPFQGHICAGNGGKFFTAISIIIMVFILFYWIFACILHNKGTIPRPEPNVEPRTELSRPIPRAEPRSQVRSENEPKHKHKPRPNSKVSSHAISTLPVKSDENKANIINDPNKDQEKLISDKIGAPD